NAAALLTATMLGIQPATAHDAAGQALYCPFGLQLTIPAMLTAHLLLGFVEAIVTGFVFAYLRRTEPGLLDRSLRPEDKARKPLLIRLGVAMLVLAILTPIGLYLPNAVGAGSAWGEWDSAEVAARTGRTPAGLEHLQNAWHAPMPDYALPGQENQPLAKVSLSYVGSAVLGCLILTSVVLAFRKRGTAG
ncbi:MAG TPA: energy-coupling factor ABC transporter permease, partial [Fimbriimonadaceae bacterium]|nr:energy-coupling factor ABC transporter permease [Fimbriimonadaceae bacterium]